MKMGGGSAILSKCLVERLQNSIFFLLILIIFISKMYKTYVSLMFPLKTKTKTKNYEHEFGLPPDKFSLEI